MPQNLPQTLALDFDGVLCDGLREYFQTSWRVYRQVWLTSNPSPPPDLAQTFYLLRPVVTTGWEMPVLLRAILKGFSESELLEHWATIRDRVVVEEDLNPKNLGARVDSTRDQWIAENLEEWLSLHRFYPGVTECLQTLLALNFPVVIITTKESRFVDQLLRQEGIKLPENAIFGKDRQRPKSEILRSLVKTLPTPIWFVEDLLPTLETVSHLAELKDVGLFLADWGYNTLRDRQAAAQDDRIQLINLSQFTPDFSTWS
jgi:phosphoglycolate phosphatase-like HAD superfamily hydrolase